MARKRRGGEEPAAPAEDIPTEYEIDGDDSFAVEDHAENAAEDRLPWLEAVEEDDPREGPSPLKLIAAVVIGLAAIAIIVGGLFWLGNRSRTDGNGEIIAAPEGDYKVRPENPGGMNVSDEGDTAYAASAGQQPEARLNPNAVPEAPVERPAPGATQRPNAAAPNAAAGQPQRPQAAPPARPAAPAANGPTIQLGAFSSSAGASRAWTALSGRFHYLAPLGHTVIPVQSGSRTLYRLRASGEGAADICRRLRMAGEDCTAID
jgi:cell division septation protein DedD